jgi:lipopolysaccharide/colanic/teichoic acid biosynthesis glycosyltransferase/glycosyltransferase involved in cell wall biosynthesis
MHPLADLRSVCELAKVLRRIAPDVVHAHTPKAGLLGMMAALATGVRLRFFTFHGLRSETLTGWRRMVVNATDRLTSLMATHVLAVSPSLRQRIVDRRLCSPDKIKGVGFGACAGVDLAAFDPALRGAADRASFRATYGIPGDAFVIGFVGRIARDKGIAELAASWETLSARHADLWLFLCGFEDPDDPPGGEDLRKLYAHPRVCVAGKLVRDMPAAYAAIDLLALPTYREGFGVAAIEAGAMKVPVVSTRVDGIVDAVRDGVTGKLVAPRNAGQLTYALDQLILDENLRKAMGEAARPFVASHFAAQEISKGVLNEYRWADLPHGLRRGSAWNRWLKRGFDVAASLALMMATAPVLLPAMLAVWLTMGAPVIFRQKRGGLRGRVFWVYKLRSMRDKQVTALGKFLRATSVDELPQLWNVLKGDMSLVGPRPLLACYRERYNTFQARRMEVRPGITGWAQVHGRNLLSWEEKFRLDVWYVDHRSFWLDMRILVLTAVRAVRPGAAAQQAATEFLGDLRWKTF